MSMMDLTASYRDKSPSLRSKATLAVIHFGILLAVLWILFAGGITTVDGVLGVEHQVGSILRRAALATAAVLYFLRTLATLFIFLKRRMPWTEVATIAVWIGALDLLFAYFGGRNEALVGLWDAVGGCLLAVGSVVHTGSEWQRHVWKQRPKNEGRLFTGGLWRFSRHINYFGDVVLFTGWALMTGRSVLLAVPALMICLFAFVNVPAQDRYLAERYPEEFEAYANRAARLIPYLY